MQRLVLLDQIGLGDDAVQTPLHIEDRHGADSRFNEKAGEILDIGIGADSVITSYSIHYTKLYDGSSIWRARRTFASRCSG